MGWEDCHAAANWAAFAQRLRLSAQQTQSSTDLTPNEKYPANTRFCDAS
jgi:hypothetical protein